MRQTNYDDQTDLHERIEALEAYDIMDTPPEPEFDGIVQIARVICRTPVALISLVEENRQWFKARVGFEPCETPMAGSVCQYALVSRELLEIPDLTADPRTKDNPLVTDEPFIRFYAGAPLITPDGIIIGSLCVIDTVIRPEGLDEEQADGLQALASQVIALFEARRLSQRKDDLFRRQKGITASLRNAAKETLAAQEAGGVGTFEIDLTRNELRASPEFYRIFHLPPARSYPTSVFETMVFSDDKGTQSTQANRADGSAALDVEYRINTPAGLRWISRTANFIRGENGLPVKMIGAVKDVTVTRRAAARIQALLDLGDRLTQLSDIESMASAAADLMAKALDATRAGFGIVDPVNETVLMQPQWTAPGITPVTGLHHFRAYGSFINDLKMGNPVVIPDVTQDPRTAANAQALLDLGIRVLVNVPVIDQGNFSLVVFVHHDMPYQWSNEEIAFVRSFGDRIQAAIARVRAESEQQLLHREMGHRLKNTLSMVLAIATQTLRPVKERQYVEAFERRVHALSTAHDVLFERNWSSAAIVQVMERTFDRLSVRDRVVLQGEDLTFGPKGTLSLSLLLHELTTNAIKYGALSNTTGKVVLRWYLTGEGENTTFHLDWQEIGGPPVHDVDKAGFGSKLIKMGLGGTGKVDVRYESSGLILRMEATLHQLQQAEH
ncbi:GAF domain-containing protein [Agrobacterium sp. Azo12]|uniref:GAF domain-containing protein n=1 Tax=Agrobacterium sp. Azo12 TaxID=3031129 RepID=UPI0023D8B1AA|nr:GAF domain-containing protein [Agrobacterium sp. Azo12]MDO5895599.1 HWE histidine kinase domain-containing protein [Agrobacterium sp. Azo12]